MVKNKFMLVIVTVLLVSLLAACGGNNNSAVNSSTNSGQSTNTEQSADNKNDELKDEYELTLAYPIFTAEPADLKEVEAAISELTKQKINTTVKLLPISIGAYNQQMNLMSSGGEKLDIYLVFGQAYASDVASGKLVELNDLLANYGQDLLANYEPEHIEAAKVSGEMYAVPILQDFTTGVPGVMMRKDLVEKHNIDVNAINSLDDLAKVYEVIKANEPDITPLGIGISKPSESYFWYDKLGDKFGVLPDFDNNLQVENLYEMAEYEQFLNTMNNWFNAGYINKDAATNQSVGSDFIKSGKYFSYFQPDRPGQANSETRDSLTEMVFAPVKPNAVSTTSNVLLTMYGISSNSKKPERAAMFLNLLYSDAELANLFLHGLEGKHYVKQADNTVQPPDGFDYTTVGYAHANWLAGNPFIAYSYTYDGPDMINNRIELNKSAVKSKALGFAFNNDPVKNEITALNNVVEQYKGVLESGTIAASEKLAEFNEKLKAAGLDKVMAEKQRQLDEWAASR